VRRPGEPLGTRCEIKNVNSIRFIGQAIEYEARRQIAILEDGGTIDQETAPVRSGPGETRSMRSKEEAHDYRYFPTRTCCRSKSTRPTWTPRARSAGAAGRQEGALHRRLRPLALRRRRARGRARLGRLLRGVAAGRDGKTAANWVINELFGRLNKEGHGIEDSPVSADQLGGIIDLIGEKVISGKIAKDVFELVWTEGGDPRELVESRGMRRSPTPARSRRPSTRSSPPTPTRSSRRRPSRRCSAGSSARS
jgi:aspartyl-tRNA(Asn)/glutamyl-tRNA(Gln) amidotransferase subunit B